jgi:hypothetical protein
MKLDGDDIIIVCPDVGAINLGEPLEKELNASGILVFEQARDPSSEEKAIVEGYDLSRLSELEGKIPIIVDDAASTAGTITKDIYREIIKPNPLKIGTCIAHFNTYYAVRRIGQIREDLNEELGEGVGEDVLGPGFDFNLTAASFTLSDLVTRRGYFRRHFTELDILQTFYDHVKKI